MRKLTLAVLGAGALLIAGCSDDPSPPPPTYSCDQSTVPPFLTCVEHGPLDDYGMSYSEWYCTSNDGIWGTAPCPTANRVAACRMGAYMGYGTQYWYDGYTDDLASLESGCTMYGGTWITYPP
jgi:hypothetical protein